MTLGRCMEALRWNQLHPDRHPRVVPYRNSRMTRIFQGPLSDGRAFMVVTVDPTAGNYDETSSCLRYAAVARDISTVARVVRPTGPAALFGESAAADAASKIDADADFGDAQPDGDSADSDDDGDDMSYAEVAAELALTQEKLLAMAAERADVEMAVRAEAAEELQKANEALAKLGE
jgi:hypothetical protein